MRFQMSSPTNTWLWKFWYEVIWLVGIVAIGIYGYLRWWLLIDRLPTDEYFTEIIICMLFLLGLAGARWRFYQFQNLKMFIITVGGVLYILTLVLRAMNMLSLSMLTTATEVYGVSMLVILSRK